MPLKNEHRMRSPLLSTGDQRYNSQARSRLGYSQLLLRFLLLHPPRPPKALPKEGNQACIPFLWPPNLSTASATRPASSADPRSTYRPSNFVALTNLCLVLSLAVPPALASVTFLDPPRRTT